jgi:hypothetical protein
MAKNKRTRIETAGAGPATPALSGLSVFLAWASLGWLIAVAVIYQDRFPWLSQIPVFPGLSTAPSQIAVFIADLKAIVLLATLTAGCAAFGSYLLRPLRLPLRSPLEELVFSLGLGIGTVGFILLALGMLQWYRPAVFWTLWAIGLALFWMRWLRGDLRARLDQAALQLNNWIGAHQGWWPIAVLVVLTLGFSGLMAFVPEIFYDSMVYHLGVPKWFLFEGGIKYYPSIHAQFPFLRQMLNLLGLALQGERLAKLLHWGSAPLIVATYQALTNRYSASKAALIAAAAFFSMPMVDMNLWTAGVDVGLTSFALLTFFAWLNGLTDPPNRTRWFILAGIFGGFCFSSKYPGMLITAALCIAGFFYVGIGERRWGAAIGENGLLGLIAFGVTLPWLAKTAWLTGNPVYPYLFKQFGGKDLLVDRLLDFTNDTGTGAKTQIIPLLITPWTQTFDGVSSFTSPGVFLLGLAGFMLTTLLGKEFRQRWFTWSCFFFALYWFCINAMTDRLRLGIPGVAIGCYLLGHAASAVYARLSTMFQRIFAVVLGVGTVLGLLTVYPTIYNSYAPWNVLLGRESAAEYLSYTHPGMDPYPAMNLFKLLPGIVPPGKRMLIVGDEKTSPCPVPFLASGVHNDSLIVQWSRDARTVDDLVARFKQEKISHMMVNVGEAFRLSPYRILNWEPRSLGLYSAFAEKHLRLVRQEQIVERYFKNASPLLLYEFSESPLAGPPSPNVLVELYEEWKAANREPGFAAKRLELLQAVDQAWPNLATIRERMAYWRSQARGRP